VLHMAGYFIVPGIDALDRRINGRHDREEKAPIISVIPKMAKIGRWPSEYTMRNNYL